MLRDDAGADVRFKQTHKPLLREAWKNVELTFACPQTRDSSQYEPPPLELDFTRANIFVSQGTWKKF